MGTEFVAGSAGFRGFEADVPEPLLTSLREGLPRSNPHLRPLDLDRRGAGIAEAQLDRLEVTFRTPETILRRCATSRDLARFRVAAGTPRVERAA